MLASEPGGRQARLRARLLMLHYTSGHADPVAVADRRTSMADARIALCLAYGVALEDIDPASGYDYSAASYGHVRASWQGLARMHGLSRFFDGPVLDRVIARWRARRPDLVVDDWVGPKEEWARD